MAYTLKGYDKDDELEFIKYSGAVIDPEAPLVTSGS
jgi:hypothetical protein